MLKIIPSLGSILRPAMLILFATAIIAVAPNIPGQSLAYGDDERPWWEDDEVVQNTSGLTGEAAKIDLSLPNIGLKDPGDMEWPYGNDFTYEANLAELFPGMPLDGIDVSIECHNRTRATGGKLTDTIKMDASEMGTRIVASIEFSAGYDKSRKTTSLSMELQMKMYSVLPIPMNMPNPIFSYEGKVENNMLIEVMKSAPMMGMDNQQSEEQAPEDGFFFSAGSATPGLTALMLTALDVEDGETATIWLVNPILFGPAAAMGPKFFRTNITELSHCSDEIRDKWDETRESTGGYTPPEDVTTLAIYLDGDTPEDLLPTTFAYIDGDGRLVRLEEPSSVETIIVELEKIESDKPWWGRRKHDDEKI